VFPIRVTLASLPPGKAAPNLNEAQPLGERDAVTARLKELLPGNSFDEQGRGVFRRPSYTLRFTLDDPALLVVEMDRAEGFAAIARVVAKTGWRAIDTEAPTFVDVDASRTAGGVVAEVSTVVDQSTVRDLSGNSGFRWAKRIAVALFGGAVLWGVWQYAGSRPDTPTPGQMANTQRMSDEVVRWAFERARRRQQLTKAIAPEFRNNPVVVQLFEFLVASVDYRASIGMGRSEVLADPQTFSRLKMPPLLPGYFVQPVRMGYTFEFTGNSLTVPLGYYDWISPTYGTFVYIARPTEGGPPSRRTFALYPDGIIFATTEDRVPTRSDTPLGP
jgi:hypothetical protein